MAAITRPGDSIKNKTIPLITLIGLINADQAIAISELVWPFITESAGAKAFYL
jgi:hypothetical protein